jgi:hypothetical protein
MVTVIDPLEELLRVARQEFPLRNHSSVFKVKALMDRLHARDFHLEQRMERLAREVSWSCDSIFHDSPFHLNLFRIPKGNGIPFHDHPQMTVFF